MSTPFFTCIIAWVCENVNKNIDLFVYKYIVCKSVGFDTDYNISLAYSPCADGPLLKLSEVLLAQLDERYKTASALSEELIKKLDERYGTADKLSETLLAKLDERYAPPICAQEAAPKNPKTNALWIDTTALRLKLWDGEIWQTVGYEPTTPEPDPDTPTEGGGEEDGKQEGESSGTDSGGTGAGGTGD